MPNTGFHLSGLLGLVDVVGAVYYLFWATGRIYRKGENSSPTESDMLKVWELFLYPIALFLSGVILHFNGWRLDPLFQFQQLLLHLIVAIALVKQTQSAD